MSAWESMPWSSALCFTLALFVFLCVAFLIWDYRRHKEQKRPMATDASIDELRLRRLARSVRQRIQTRKLANGR